MIGIFSEFVEWRLFECGAKVLYELINFRDNANRHKEIMEE